MVDSSIAGGGGGYEKRTLISIQILRGLAALMVVAHHTTILFDERFHGGAGVRWLNGAAGVDIFFIISGFVMSLTSRGLTGGHGAWTFIKRRVQRVAPLYWLATTLKLVLLLLVARAAVHPLGSLWNIVASYLFLPSVNSSGNVLPVLVVGWTLNFEMLFYLLFALTLLLRVRPMLLLTPVLILMSAVSFIPRDHISGMMTLFQPILLEFLFGIFLCQIYRSTGHRVSAWAWVALAGGLTVLALVSGGGSSIYRPLLWGLPAFSIVWGGLKAEEVIARTVPRWLSKIGDDSYSIYLAHTFVLPVLGYALAWSRVNSLPVLLIACLLASVLVGHVVHVWVEEPIANSFKKRYTLPMRVE